MSAEGAQVLNPFHPRFRNDPHPVYHFLRDNDPVHRTPFGIWVLTRYDDCLAVLKDPEHVWSHNIRHIQAINAYLEAGGEMQPLHRMMSGMLVFEDPPDHTRLRGLVNLAFTRGVVESLRPSIERIIGELLDAVALRGEMDLVSDFSYPLPVLVISDLLGVPREDAYRFRHWTRDLTVVLEPQQTPEQLAAATVAEFAFIEYFVGLVEKRRSQPGEDLISRLIAAEAEGDKLTTWEMIVNLIFLLIAGHETTMNLIANGMYALQSNPDELRRLREDDSLMESAVEELIRYDGPVHMTGRIALQDIPIGDKVVPKGSEVIALLAAGDRDPARFPDPDRLDIGRADNKHLGFGHGAHFCLGAPLSRVEVPMAFRALFERFPNLRLAGVPVTYRPSTTLRGVQSLPLLV